MPAPAAGVDDRHQPIERPLVAAATRAAFLADACAGDDDLRRDVESLFQQDAANAFLDRSVWATAAPLLVDDSSLAPVEVPAGVLRLSR